ncbi:MAG: hypothetical protein WCQ70_11170 [Lentimicrobiaceae bacterium]
MERKNIIFWLIAIVITLSLSIYQRTTGPTRPVKGELVLAGKSIEYKLLRTYSGPDDAEITIEDPTGKLEGAIKYKRYKSKDEWLTVPMNHQNNKLVAAIPHQPPAGKVMYQITLTDGTNSMNLTPDPVIIRFKGDVPAYVLIPHILFMFLAMIFSTRTGIEAIAKGPRTKKYSLITALLLIVGGFVFGPIVQKYAFGEYWTGIPFGWDLTDNKTAIALVLWIIAIYKVWKNPEKRGWALIAALVMTLVYLIPHSLFGSEIDYTE